MKNLYVVLFLLSLSINNSAFAGNYTSDSISDKVQKAKEASVLILSYDKDHQFLGHGSGFFISQDGELATCYHVVKGAYEIKVKTELGKTYNVDRILRGDETFDMAIIKINGGNEVFPFVKISKIKPKSGENLYVIGSPADTSFFNTVTNGIVSKFYEKDERGKGAPAAIQTNAGFTNGNSGGPVFNSNFEVVGLSSSVTQLKEFKVYETTWINFAGWIGDLEVLPIIDEKRIDSAKNLGTLAFNMNSYFSENIYLFINFKYAGQVLCNAFDIGNPCSQNGLLNLGLAEGVYTYTLMLGNGNYFFTDTLHIQKNDCRLIEITATVNNYLLNRKEKNELAIQQIKMLEKSALIVRLHSNEILIKKLEESNNSKLVEVIKTKTKAKNESIINAFKTSFNFCPVFFIFSNQSDLIINKKFKDVTFLNQFAELDTNIKFSYCGFLTGEFGYLDQNISALKINDQYFKELSSPFPYYVFTYQNLLQKRKLNKSISKLNEKLVEFNKIVINTR